ncbi:5,6-dimethylbenzimidazole synthase [Pontivivens insulae]|uniref:5,6-dimethylbenzimidazole synthase n=1 Tax=Pontivivens insulae TaxID=1639689 RepID=A0A2R8ADW9_9RHOB|nr:5,6-dimethylbenzimidazole synthase [Pontivivens insulae]RED14342.1 cob(II)yrinic acid a,c-diamide reductase [Pontivivens insulae]SPF30419.1 5,6-dimethylbenzimidazole synthase [Pontivivens insulae]
MHRFSDDFAAELTELLRWRRDVRRFRTDPVPEALIDTCLEAVRLAPSVGLSAPWRFIRVTSVKARDAACSNFEAANAEALQGYSGEKAARYASLKLTGMREAPVQFAVFCDDSTEKGAGLGAGTMPEARAYSVVGAIMYMWLTARAHGLGLGWVSILDPERLTRDLEVRQGWTLVAYLCMGWPEEDNLTPELIKAGWETAAPLPEVQVR